MAVFLKFEKNDISYGYPFLHSPRTSTEERIYN